MSIPLSEPSIPHIFDDLESTKLAIQSRTQRVKKRLQNKELYPELGIIRDTAMACKEVIENQGRICAAFNAVGSVRGSSTLKKLYKSTDLELVTTKEQMKTLLEFTRWLFLHYKEVHDVGYPFAMQIVRQMRIDHRGRLMNTQRGILHLRYRDQDGVGRTQMYSFRRHHGEQGGSYATLTLVPDVVLESVDTKATFLRDELFICNTKSLVTAVCEVSAPLESTVLPLLRVNLLTSLLRASGLKVERAIVR